MHRQRPGDGRQRLGIFQRQRRHLVEQRFFHRQRLFAGFGDAAGQGGQLVGGKTHRPRHGLAMAEQILASPSTCRHAAGVTSMK